MAKDKVNFDSLYLSAFKVEEKTNKAPDIRASSMPFCPKKFLFKFYEFLDNGSRWDFFGDFYCNIGTSIHSTVQKWVPLASPGYLLGDWRCRKCKRIVACSVGPFPCPNCGTLMSYQEFSLKFLDAPVTGHCDGVIIDKLFALEWMKKSSRYKKLLSKGSEIVALNQLIHSREKIKIPAWVLELKSTGIYNAKSITQPSTSHMAQSTIYTSGLKKILPHRFGIHTIKVKGYLIKYISRDNPRVRSKDLKKRVKDDGFYYLTCKMVNTLFDSFKTLKVKKLYKTSPCKQLPEIYKDCAYDSMCEETSKKELKKILKKVRRHFKKSKQIEFNLFG